MFSFMLWLFYLQVKRAFGICYIGDWASLAARLEAVAKGKIAALDRSRTPAFVFLSQSLC
jgi:class 3 adenylate cyclase